MQIICLSFSFLSHAHYSLNFNSKNPNPNPNPKLIMMVLLLQKARLMEEVLALVTLLVQPTEQVTQMARLKLQVKEQQKEIELADVILLDSLIKQAKPKVKLLV